LLKQAHTLIKSSFAFFCSILFFSVLLLPIASFAAKGYFTHLDNSDGLPDNSVGAILQDKSGYIWFATENGVAKYDGEKIKIYRHNHKNLNCLSSNCVWSAIEDKKGYIWFATQRGLTRMNPITETFRQYYHNPKDVSTISDNLVLSFCIDNDNKLWVGTAKDGINIYNAKEDNFLRLHLTNNYQKHSKTNKVIRLLADKHGAIWVGTNHGLYSIDSKTYKITEYKSDQNDLYAMHGTYIRTLYEDNTGKIWIGGIGEQINIYDYDSKIFYHKKIFLPLNNQRKKQNIYVYQIIQDSNNVFWFGLYGGGIVTYDPKKKIYQHYKHDIQNNQSLSSNNINYLYKDRNDIIWIGTYKFGVNKFSSLQQRFKFYTPVDYGVRYDDYSRIRIIFEYKKHQVWLINLQHTYIYDEQNKTITNKIIKHNGLVLSVANMLHNLCVVNGKIWISTSKYGIICYNPKTDETVIYNQENSNICNDIIYKLIRLNKFSDELWIVHPQDLEIINVKTGKITKILNKCQLQYMGIKDLSLAPQNILWISTNKAVLTYNIKTRKLKTYTTDKRYINGKLYAAHNGDIWVMTIYGIAHIDKYHKSTFYPFEKLDWRKENVWFEDKNNNIWFSRNGELNKYDSCTNTLLTYTSKNGLAEKIIREILEDKDGNIWIIHQYSISKFDVKKDKITNFNSKDGIEIADFYKATISSTNNIYVSGNNGILIFNTRDLGQPVKMAPTIITDIKLFNESIPVGKKLNGRVILKQQPTYCKHITLKYDENIITLNFATLNYHSKSNSFRCILKNFEKRWNDLQYFNSITYKHIPPGNYIFQVFSLHKDGTTGTSSILKITILPPYWKTRWFKAIAILLIIFILVFVQILWSRQTKHYNYQLIKINLALNHEITKREQMEKEIAKHHNNLELMVQQRTEELKDVHEKLIQTARQAGRAEVATGVLHNAGNVLNSIKVTITILESTVNRAKVQAVQQIAKIINKPKEQLAEYITTHPKGIKTPKLLKQVGMQILQNKNMLKKQIKELKTHIQHISQIIKIQLYHSKSLGTIEKISINKIINNVVKIVTPTTEEYGITVNIETNQIEESALEQYKIIQVLTNILQNAKESVIENNLSKKIITISSKKGKNKTIIIKITDNGLGISVDKLDKILSIGYTSKKYGNGFGLHNAKEIIQEMGGTLQITSPGENKGATCTITIPFIEY